jgi:tRNA threonylcarbamoyl adenosine modification protein (Sua5/YciO/YrdC/YwlC family)
MSPKRKTTGIRVPDHAICQSLLEALGNPIISTSATTVGNADGMRISQAELFDRLDKLVDLIVDDQSPVGDQVSTILDLTGDEPAVVRQGLGWEAIAHWVGEAAS